MKAISALMLSAVTLAALVLCFDKVGALPTGLQVERVQLTDLEPLYEHVDDNGGDDNAGIRQARVTCDLLSVETPWGSLGHSACAARCLLQRKKGGRCIEGVCHCRE